MKKSLVCMIFASLLTSATALAGNEQKRGQAGATELLINPWARSSGWAGAHTAGVRGIEAANLNIGGMAHTKGTEIVFANTQWLKGSDVSINAFGLSQSVGDNGGVIGLSVMALDLGDFIQTTENQPDQTIFFQPNFLNIGLSYAKVFSNSIYGGITVRVISQSIPDASAQGIAFDGGVQYITSLGDVDEDTKNFRVGVSLRNVGPEMRFSGDGLSYRGNVLGTQMRDPQALNQRAETFEMPSLLNIGVAYDLDLGIDHRLTVAGNFNSNSFTNDQVQLGVEYAFMENFMVRGGFDYQKNIFDNDTRTVAHTGPTLGASIQREFGEDKEKSFGIDYSYRSSNPFDGTHSIGIRLVL